MEQRPLPHYYLHQNQVKELRDDLSNQTDDLKTKRKITELCCSKGTELTEIAKQKPAFYQIKPLIWQVLSKKNKRFIG